MQLEHSLVSGPGLEESVEAASQLFIEPDAVLSPFDQHGYEKACRKTNNERKYGLVMPALGNTTL